MFIVSRLRSAAALSGFCALLLAGAGPASAQAEGPGPEEMAALSAAAPAVLVSATAAPTLATPVLAATAALPTAAFSAGLPREVLEAAGAYRFYMRQAAGLSASFADGASIASALKLGAAFESKQLTRGAVAFAALAALHEPSFVDGVRALGADPARRAALVASLTDEPHRVAELPGAGAAAGRAVAALGGEGERVRAAGVRVKQAAYDVQRQAWAKTEVADRVERLATVKALSAQPVSAPAAELVELQLAALGAGRLELPAGPADAVAQPVVQRGLALAALALLGQADAARTEPLMDDAACGSCLRMSKLNLFQCLAVAKPWYEDVFCLGQHVLIDTGDCIQAAAVRRPAALPATAIAAAPAPAREPEPQGGSIALTTVAALR